VAAVLQPYVDKGVLAGAVTLVADREKVLDISAVGYSDLAAHMPMTIDELFWIASMSKPITAAALMLLVDEGKVSLDDPVDKFLPEFKDLWVTAEKADDHLLLRRPEHKMTVREIMSHMSGLPFKSALEQPMLDMTPLRDGARSYAMTPLLWQPGSRYLYSNAGINTGGRIIEVVSGMPYQDFLKKRLTDPLGMTDTTFWPTTSQLKRLAKSYRPKGKAGLEATLIGQLTYPLDDPQRQPMPGGGLFSTAKDMARFGQMLLNRGNCEGKQVLNESSVEAMTTRQTPMSVPQSYGLGMMIGNGSYGHGGAYATNLTVDTKHGLVEVFMVQHAGFPGDGKDSLGVFRKAAEDRFGGRK
jgi:CubicO group peptidase (beta-lactamase class C family)